MELKLKQSLVREIRAQYDSGCDPVRKAEVDRFCRELSETQADCLKFLYTHMPVQDLVSYPVETIYSYVEATLSMFEKTEYAAAVPQELFLTYVLGYRVNNENLDGSRKILFDALYPRVKGKTMEAAALEVNYWCFEKATYTPTDDRTIAPLGMMKAARGRCGEESTFTVSALRAVGIPARQCYCPRWAHCDDNHAWVELWVDGAWHYMGACEPEPVLDKGWFTAAASKAMLVHSKAYSHLLTGEDVAGRTRLYSLINSTPVYGPCRRVRVQILDGGQPQKGVEVHFQLVNDCQLHSIYTGVTDGEGSVSFTTGLGDLFLFAQDSGRVVCGRLDVRQGDFLALELEEGYRPEALAGPITLDFDMNPPKETVNAQPIDADWEAHDARFRACARIRENYEETFEKGGFLEKARGNQGEIRKFLEDPRFDREDKIQVLSTLRDKDFLDTEAETLASTLEAALPYKKEFPEEIYVPWLLAPRIADEMLTPHRGKIAEFLRNEDLREGKQVWDYLKNQIRIVPSFGIDNFVADPWGMLRYGMGPENSFPTLFVAVCRSLGIPARLNGVTGELEFVRMVEGRAQWTALSHREQQETHCLTLVNQAGQDLRYRYQFTLAQWKNGAYQTLQFGDAQLHDTLRWNLAGGSYRLLTAARQIDGSISASSTCFRLDGDLTLPVALRPDRTQEKLRHVPLAEPEGVPLWKALGCGKSVLIFADPGMEPTEHLFQELLECREEFNRAGHRILIFLEKPSQNATLQRVLEELKYASVLELKDPAYFRQLHADMEVGDERLPFTIAIDEKKRGLFAFANYNIRTAQTLLTILLGPQGGQPVRYEPGQ